MASLLRWYNAQLAVRPIFTQSWTSMILWGFGDIVAQKIVPPKPVSELSESDTSIDWRRVARFSLIGGIIAGPILSNWYRILDRAVTFSSANINLLARVIMDQLVFAPCMIAFIFSTLSVAEGKNQEQIRKKLQITWWSALKNNWKVWPAIQVINFKVTPLQYRLLVVNTISMGWNTYISALNSQTSPRKEGAISLDNPDLDFELDQDLELNDVTPNTGTSMSSS